MENHNSEYIALTVSVKILTHSKYFMEIIIENNLLRIIIYEKNIAHK
tara:strand:+ start:813 stop:953 length:141 start_codon:yes stop_codon:yes gene_type:complete